MKRKIFSLDAYRLYKIAKIFREKKLYLISNVIDQFNSFIHNSFISSECEIGRGSIFAYGGIGIVIHRKTKIGSRCMIGQGITIGSKGSTNKNPKISAPIIGNGVYIGAGARIIGEITIGDYCLIAPNAVVIKDVEPYSVVGGIPAKVIDKITLDTYNEKYRYYYGIENAYED